MDSDEYEDMVKAVEEAVVGLYDEYGPVSLAVTLLTAVAVATLHGYAGQIKDTIGRAIDMLTAIKEDKGTLQ